MSLWSRIRDRHMAYRILRILKRNRYHGLAGFEPPNMLRGRVHYPDNLPISTSISMPLGNAYDYAQIFGGWIERLNGRGKVGP